MSVVAVEVHFGGITAGNLNITSIDIAFGILLTLPI